MDTISRQDLKEKIANDENFVLVEALPKEDYDSEHLPHAVNLPVDDLKNAGTVLPDKDAEIVVYCRSTQCHASDTVAQSLEEAGYRNVKVYKEGKEDWIKAGLPTSGAHQHA